MGSKINPETFYNLIASKAGGSSTPSASKRFWLAFYDVLLDELRLNGELYIYGFGKFILKERGGYDKMSGNFEEGGRIRVYVNKTTYIDFEPSELFTRAIQGDFKRVDRNQKKRKYKNRAEQIESIKRERHEEKKAKLTPEEIICGHINQINNAKKKENGKDETNI